MRTHAQRQAGIRAIGCDVDGGEARPANGKKKGTVALLIFVPVRVPSPQRCNGERPRSSGVSVEGHGNGLSGLGMPLLGPLSSGSWQLCLLSAAAPAGYGNEME